MFFETELSDKLNIELEAAGVSVSDALIARTLEAVKQARAEEKEVALEQEIKSNVRLITEARATKYKSLSGTLFRAAGVIAACFVLVVGGFALRFATMRTGKDSAAPMATAMESVRTNGGSTMSDTTDMVMEDCDSVAVPEAESECDYGYAVADEAYSVVADAVDAVQEEPEQENGAVEMPEEQNAVALLTESLMQAESVMMSRNEQGIRLYEFFVRDSAGEPGYYLIYENGAVEFAQIPPLGQTRTMEAFDGSDNEEFRRAVLVWMKEHGYSF